MAHIIPPGSAQSASSVLPSTGTAGAPVAGTWTTDQLAFDSADRLWLCTAGGTPGNWVQPSSSVPFLAIMKWGPRG